MPISVPKGYGTNNVLKRTGKRITRLIRMHARARVQGKALRSFVPNPITFGKMAHISPSETDGMRSMSVMRSP